MEVKKIGSLGFSSYTLNPRMVGKHDEMSISLIWMTEIRCFFLSKGSWHRYVKLFNNRITGQIISSLRDIKAKNGPKYVHWMVGPFTAAEQLRFAQSYSLWFLCWLRPFTPEIESGKGQCGWNINANHKAQLDCVSCNRLLSTLPVNAWALIRLVHIETPGWYQSALLHNEVSLKGVLYNKHFTNSCL